MPPLGLSPEEFRELADRVVIAATDYLALLNDRPIFPATTDRRTQALFGQPLAEEGFGAEAFEELVEVMEHARAGNGRFFGYVLAYRSARRLLRRGSQSERHRLAVGSIRDHHRTHGRGLAR